MSKKFLFSGIASAFVLALSLQFSPALADETHGMTNKDAAVAEHVVIDPKPLVKEKSSDDNSEVQVARLFSLFGR
ncbi:MAG: hypothetical protein QNJ62_01435 [Methyloceanibacter sp.]|nr:hypothetical protein [Methyloceanibacter sp.]